MNLPMRLESALEKLYLAFYEGTLNPENCCHCAVGNICDRVDSWKYFTDRHGSVKLNYLGRLNENLGKRINGYSPLELLGIEAVFLKGCGYTFDSRQKLLKPAKMVTSDMMFRGLCNVVDFLCELEGMDNVMDQYKKFNLKPETSHIPSD